MAKTKQKVSMPAGIRNKLLAAVSMLMVSSIMLVSSTYAWFTLSTAPEVKNISTTVAGNGSLEIALMPSDGLLGSIKSGFASDANGGTVAVTTANTTWGNIINLSDASYGLNRVNLNPAQLNASGSSFAEGGASKPLAIATYGYDGRIDEISAITALKAFEDSAFKGSGYGVRAIGEDDGSGTLTSTYGYVVDLAFRLNASNNSGSTSAAGKLLLQTDGKQRIYNGETGASTNAQTMGGGSYMSINANGTGLDVAKLMEAIRITFIQDYGKSGVDAVPTIIGTAKLDMSTVSTGATATTAKLYLYDASGSKLADNAAVLVPEMTRNAAVQVSALVWLDGEQIKNASVAAINSTMAQATLNLQFSTDVELKPANNNALFQGSAE